MTKAERQKLLARAIQFTAKWLGYQLSEEQTSEILADFEPRRGSGFTTERLEAFRRMERLLESKHARDVKHAAKLTGEDNVDSQWLAKAYPKYRAEYSRLRPFPGRTEGA